MIIFQNKKKILLPLNFVDNILSYLFNVLYCFSPDFESVFEHIQSTPKSNVANESTERHRVIQKLIILNDVPRKTAQNLAIFQNNTSNS